MNLEGLIAQFRVDSDDAVAPFLWGDEALAAWFTEAADEAALRGRLLHESSDPAVCQIAVTVGRTSYPLHEALYEIDYLSFKPTGATVRQVVTFKSREELDRIEPDWREKGGEVRYALQGDTSIRLALTPETAGTLYLEGFRLPLDPLANDGDEPEIHRSHHVKLVHWALHRAFSKPDAETVDPTRAAAAEKAFTAYFGLRPDSDLRRAARHDVEHHNTAFWA